MILNIMAKYKLTADELLLVYLSYIACSENGNGDQNRKYFHKWYHGGGSERLRMLFESLKSKGIILDLTSAISANPLLQIDEFDVEANHGASIGAIDDEDLYYLMSRGLTKAQSEQLIVSGYMQPILSKMNEEQLQKYASFLIENKLK